MSPSVQSVSPSSATALTNSPSSERESHDHPEPLAEQALCQRRREDPLKECKLKAGTYTSTPFKVPFQFTIDDGWTNSLAGINAGQLKRAKPPERASAGPRA